jgi:uncharacterized membrane protein YqjE
MSKVTETHEASVQGALEQVVLSGQQLIIDRLDLMQIELREAVREAKQRALGLALAAIVGLVAFVTATVSVVLFLSQVMSTAAAALLVSAVYGAASLGTVLWARHRHASFTTTVPTALGLGSSTT